MALPHAPKLPGKGHDRMWAVPLNAGRSARATGEVLASVDGVVGRRASASVVSRTGCYAGRAGLEAEAYDPGDRELPPRPVSSSASPAAPYTARSASRIAAECTDTARALSSVYA